MRIYTDVRPGPSGPSCDGSVCQDKILSDTKSKRKMGKKRRRKNKKREKRRKKIGKKNFKKMKGERERERGGKRK